MSTANKIRTEERNRMRKMYEEGKGHLEIAQYMYRSPNAVLFHLHLSGARMRPQGRPRVAK